MRYGSHAVAIDDQRDDISFRQKPAASPLRLDAHLQEMIANQLDVALGDVSIPSFFAKANGRHVETCATSFAEVPASWCVSMDQLCAAFETSSALITYLAACADAAIRDRFLNDLQTYEFNRLHTEIEYVREQGYSLYDHSNIIDGLFSLAVPVSYRNEAIGAVGVFLTRALSDAEHIEKTWLPLLNLVAHAISSTLENSSKTVLFGAP